MDLSTPYSQTASWMFCVVETSKRKKAMKSATIESTDEKTLKMVLTLVITDVMSFFTYSVIFIDLKVFRIPFAM